MRCWALTGSPSHSLKSGRSSPNGEPETGGGVSPPGWTGTLKGTAFRGKIPHPKVYRLRQLDPDYRSGHGTFHAVPRG